VLYLKQLEVRVSSERVTYFSALSSCVVRVVRRMLVFHVEILKGSEVLASRTYLGVADYPTL
jgi:hypothetical protein